MGRFLKKILILPLIMYSMHASGNIPLAYQLDGSTINISDANFRRYVRPLVKYIVGDFYQILKSIDPFVSNVINLRQKYRGIYTLYKQAIDQCNKSSSETCRNLFQNLYIELSQYDALLLKSIKEISQDIRSFQVKPLKNKMPSVAKKISVTLDEKLYTLRILYKLSLLSFQNLRVCEQLLVAPESFPNLWPDLEEANVYHSIALIDGVPDPYRPYFRSIWSNFVGRLEDQILNENNKDFLQKNLGELNFIWNDFRSTLTKNRHKRIKKVGSHVLAMHNRWNLILKLILK